MISSSKRGRSWPVKGWDQRYVQLLASSQFVLCPDGDFVWTYRFFEAIAAGAIPIVENESPHYEGFHFALMSEPLDKARWPKSLVEENHEQLRRVMTVPAAELRAQVEASLRS